MPMNRRQSKSRVRRADAVSVPRLIDARQTARATKMCEEERIRPYRVAANDGPSHGHGEDARTFTGGRPGKTAIRHLAEEGPRMSKTAADFMLGNMNNLRMVGK